MARNVQDAQVSYSDADANRMKAEYEAEGYFVTLKRANASSMLPSGAASWAWLVTAYEKEDK